MFVDGTIVTAPPRDRLSPGPLVVRTYVRHECSPGYTLFSTAFGSTEYLIDMNGMVVHTWPVQRSQYAELLPNGSLMADICCARSPRYCAFPVKGWAGSLGDKSLRSNRITGALKDMTALNQWFHSPSVSQWFRV